MKNFDIDIKDILSESREAKKRFISDADNVKKVSDAVSEIINCFNRGNKVLVFGNGGSAADSQHFAAELQVRFEKERKALPCIALTTDSSILTAAANDYDFTKIFSRQIESLAVPGDVAFAISTSGNSDNVTIAAEKARDRGMKVISLSGGDGGRLAGISDIPVIVRENVTARIQEIHITVIHAVCKIVEEAFCDDKR
jgi:D-sedoheptulose 7-phosphate isomerase